MLGRPARRLCALTTTITTITAHHHHAPGIRLGKPISPPSPPPSRRRRLFSTDAASHAANKTQIYVLRSRDPFVNLSIEHHLLQASPPHAVVLLLYRNAPSVVFGRNQNPWLEADLARLADTRSRRHDEAVRLVRRRSGGGTVFHDEGNVNFSVICPPAVFDRDRHAEMVVRALRSLGRPDTRVNERHDIVMDAPPSGQDQGGTFKISGSAYKLTRLRSLHHGTCLLRSPNLASISGLLRSPAEPFIRARGVDSVRSPVRNVGVDGAAFEEAVVAQFEAMYGPADLRSEVGEEALAVQAIRDGCGELRSRAWIYGQTPRFTFSTHPTDEDPRPRPTLPSDVQLRFEARHGIIEQCSLQWPDGSPLSFDQSLFLKASLQDIDDWSVPLAKAGLNTADASTLGSYVNGVLGVEFTKVEL